MAKFTKSRFGRRDFLITFAAGLAIAPWRSSRARSLEVLDNYFQKNMLEHQVPGLAIAVLRSAELLWSRGYGYSDLARQTPMSADTLLNIGSISKTFTATAVMQLWERSAFRLDDDVSDHLSFSLRNPCHPDTPITFRQLLNHTSSLTDCAAYTLGYACGDPAESLQEWLAEFLIAGGRYYEPGRNFHCWAPGEKFGYANISFGLLALLVENVSGLSFEAYCQQHIFRPLGMLESSWYLSGVDRENHAIPYTWIEGGVARGPSWDGVPVGVVSEGRNAQQVDTGHVANCLYSHPNYPDGFLRSSVNQLALYAAAYLRQGRHARGYLLEPETIRMMFTPETGDEKRVMGLAWNARQRPDGPLLWGHGGNDPGMNSYLLFRFEDGTAAIVLMNTNNMDPIDGPLPVQFAEYLVDHDPYRKHLKSE